MIDTAIYGLHKPDDTDLADLRVFVGQNMDLIETALETKLNSQKIASGSQAGIVQIGNGLGMSGNYLYFKAGDGLILNNSTYLIDVNRGILDTWYSPKPLSVTGLPVSVPSFVGQMAIDSVDGRTYVAEGVTSNDWKRLATTIYVDVADNFIINTVLNGLSLWNGTQIQYDSIVTKNDNTIYYIIG